MPLIYGKKAYSMSKDIASYDANSILTKKEYMDIAIALTAFFNERFAGIKNLMDLIQNVGLILSASNKPVCYNVPSLYKTTQDYMSSKLIHIWLYYRKKHDSKNKNNKTRCKVSLRIPVEIRDKRKTKVSTFVNFIHQKDAGVAMSMVKRLINDLNAPIYTVHDNFITTAPYAYTLSWHYLNTYIEGINRYYHHPLRLINSYLIENLYSNIPPGLRPSLDKPISISINELDRVLYSYKHKSKRVNKTWDKTI